LLFIPEPAESILVTREDNNASYAIILHNVRTYRSAGVVAIVRGKPSAEAALRQFQEAANSGDYHEGWRYFMEKTDLAVGTEPNEATNLRQAELERREANAPREAESGSRPSSNTQNDT
jgi:hypothetical protein